ncbi:MAG: LarC family nickel insertion protein [Kiritimatiellae bacterium]|nr:LarC family nickel insertion protein [Kiritimatiellia bacterium]
MKTLYLECTMGAAGDMLTAALLELVPDRAAALARITALGIPGVHVHADPATVCGLVGTRVDVHIHGHTEEEHHHHHNHDHNSTGADAQERVPPVGHGHHHHHASRADLAAQIAALTASDAVKAHVQAVYDLIADAEAKAHGRPVSEIHFHEVGMADALSDIAAVALLLEELGPVRVVASRPEVGGGFVQCAHGTLPVPAPATAHILMGVPYTSGAANCELLTPTGAALLVHFADAFGPMPPFAVERTGLGLGHREMPGRLNGVRAFLGEETGGTRSCASATGPNGRVAELRASIDDMTGEDLAFACDKLRAAGALDVSLAPLTMKKGRPGHLLIVLAPLEQADALAAAILRETSTFGVRRVDCARYELDREIVPGNVRVKVGRGYGVEKSKPEFADRAAHAHAQAPGVQA